jgi:hypothetical protein
MLTLCSETAQTRFFLPEVGGADSTRSSRTRLLMYMICDRSPQYECIYTHTEILYCMQKQLAHNHRLTVNENSRSYNQSRGVNRI